MIESLLLALAGGALGLVIASWASGAESLFGLPPASAALGLRAIAFTGAIAVVTAVAFGLAPALSSTRAGVASVLRDGSGGSSRRFTLQRGLLSLQAALSLVVIVAAGLFVRSLRNVQAVDLGLDVHHVLTVTIPLDRAGFDSAARVAFFDRAIERLSTLPGVAAAAYSGMPLFEGFMGLSVTLPGQDTSVRDRRGFNLNFVGPGFLRAYGTRLVKGRDITAADRAGTLPVAVVNETMARRLWPGKDAIGECMQVSSGPGGPAGPPPCTYVVGIMADGKYQAITESPMAYFLLPRAQRDEGFQHMIIVRTVGDPYRLAPTVRQAVIALAPNLPYIDVRAISDRLDPQLQPYRIGALLFTTFGVVALILAAIGLYGVVAYAVTQRTREAGIRLALGARGGDVLVLMLREGFLPALGGAAVGVAGAVAVARLLQSQLYGVSPTDPTTVTLGALLLAAIAALACSIPARRAARVDPVIALRSE
jgi:predicted permease